MFILINENLRIEIAYFAKLFKDFAKYLLNLKIYSRANAKQLKAISKNVFNLKLGVCLTPRKEIQIL